MKTDGTAALSLKRSQRITRGRDFQVIRGRGERSVCGCVVANWRCLPGAGESRVAVITSRRIGNAVCRNRARRLMREVFRVSQNELNQSVEMVLIARRSIRGRRFSDVNRDYRSILNRAQLLKQA